MNAPVNAPYIGKRPSRPRGLTLIELMIALAIAVMLLSLALPSMLASLQRHRLKGAAEALAADLTEARFEAARRGVPVHFEFTPGAEWCYAANLVAGCDCHSRQPCQIKSVRADDARGVGLADAQNTHFAPDNGARTQGGSAVLQVPSGERLKVQLSGMGRASICAPDGGIHGYPNC
jgi:type IV fimbrial biogenesis protein FimT